MPGINFIDTANVYSDGASEIITGQALKNLKVPRENLVVTTKILGETSTKGANSRSASRYHIIDSVKASLKRLQLDHVDLYQIHGFDPARRSRKLCARSTIWCSTATCAISACQTGRRGRS